MKLTKKIACAVLASAMSLTSVAALAVTPNPVTVDNGFALAQQYINAGLYYEADEMLHKLELADTLAGVYETQKADQLHRVISSGIEDWEIESALNRVAAAYAANDVFEAREQLLSIMTSLGIYGAVPGSATSNGVYGATDGVGDPFEDATAGRLLWTLDSADNAAVPAYAWNVATTWGGFLGGVYNLDYAQATEMLNWAQVLDSIDTPAQAIVAAERASGTYLNLPTLEYRVSRFTTGDNGWDVYVVDTTTGNNIRCYHVFADIADSYTAGPATGVIRTAPRMGNWAAGAAGWTGPADPTSRACDVVEDFIVW